VPHLPRHPLRAVQLGLVEHLVKVAPRRIKEGLGLREGERFGRASFGDVAEFDDDAPDLVACSGLAH
jgi:hypothetical protein